MPLIHEISEPGAPLESTIELDEGVAPEKCPVINSLAYPFLDLRIAELLESMDIGPIGVLDIGENVEGIHILRLYYVFY
jgi:hypothetical protein